MKRSFGSGKATSTNLGEKCGILGCEVGRGQVLKRAGQVVGGVVLAGSLGTPVGCGTGTIVERSTVPSGGTDASADRRAQGATPGSTGAADCPFCEGGRCSRNGEACTNCRTKGLPQR